MEIRLIWLSNHKVTFIDHPYHLSNKTGSLIKNEIKTNNFPFFFRKSQRLELNLEGYNHPINETEACNISTAKRINYLKQ